MHPAKQDSVAVTIDEKHIDSIFADLDQWHLPGAAVGIALGGEPVYRRGFGLANMELPVLLSPSIRMRIYSATKHFACLAYLLLCEDGRADPDDPIGTFLPEIHSVAHRVTMRQLMGHVGGLRDAHDINWQFSGQGKPVSSADVLSLYRDIDDVNFEPGSSWCYNNGGYLLLTAAIERICGQSLEEVLWERIFAPLRMHDTLLRRFDSDFVPNSATMHMTTSTGSYDRSYMGTATAGEGGIVSTVDDMLRWLAHMDAPVIGSAATWSLIKAPQILRNGTSTGYGLGLISTSYRGVETLSHPGGGPGANAQMLKVPAAGLDVIVMVNRHDVSSVDLVNRILDACLPGLGPTTPRSKGPFLEGTFRSPATGRVMHFFVRDEQQMVLVGGNELPLAADRDGIFRLPAAISYVKLEFAPFEPLATTSAIRVNEFGNRDVLMRMPPRTRPSADTIAGRYRCGSAGTDVTITATGEGACLETVGRFGSMTYELECLCEGIWKTKSHKTLQWLGGILTFERDGAGFRYSNLFTRSLPFYRCG